MDTNKIEGIVKQVITDYCKSNNISIEINQDTPLIGSNRVMTSLGLVNVIVDIETTFLDEGVEISLTSESAMSGKISPFRSVGSLCYYIAHQLGLEK